MIVHRLFVLLALAAPFLARAQTPEELVSLYFGAMKSGQTADIVSHMHPEEVESFHRATFPVIQEGLEAAANGEGDPDAFAMKLLLGDDTPETVLTESPPAFFGRFLRWVMALNPAMQAALSRTDVTVIGSVPEGDTLLHVVYRLRMPMEGDHMTQMHVMSLKQYEGAWKLMLSGDIQSMSRLFQATPPGLPE